MKLSEIKELISVVDKSGLVEFEYKTAEGDQLVMRKQASSAPTSQPTVVQPIATPGSVPDDAKVDSSADPAESLALGQFMITSPMVGVFYRAPAPDAPPFVAVGDVVEPGQTVCIVEAMKLMNEIEAERRGRVVRILVENEDPVEYGQPLFVLQEL
jgi:acetyl-CoA carboxylase biotin carboxyl carrier protein